MHRINLKGPWGYQPLEGNEPGALPASGTVKFPAVWQDILGDFRGCVRFSRPFNRPTNLEPQERVNLLFDGIGGRARVSLNEELVGTIDQLEFPIRFEITSLLQLHNQLQIDVDWSGPATESGGLWAPVALEIASA